MLIRSYCVEDLSISQIYKHLETLIDKYSRKIFNNAQIPEKINTRTDSTQILPQLSDESELQVKYDSLLKMKKYITAMAPTIFKRYLERFSEIKIEEIAQIRDIPAKLEILPAIIENYTKNMIICSFIPMAEMIQQYFEELQYKIFIISRMTYDKDLIMNNFRQYTESKAILIISQIRDINLHMSEIDSIIFFDIVDTTKIMYQCIKEIKKGEMICLYYKNTNEKEKNLRIFTDIGQKYPELQIGA